MVVEGFIVIWLHWDSRGGLAGKCRRGASGHIVLASMYGQRASNASGQVVPAGIRCQRAGNASGQALPAGM